MKNMNLDQFKLGECTNLLDGYKAGNISVPFTSPKKLALYEKSATIKNPDSDAKWSYPTITLHEGVEELLATVLQVKVRPVSLGTSANEDGASAHWPTGALLLAGLTDSSRQKALKDLSSQLGIDLSKKDLSFALVRLSRYIGTAKHPCFERGVFGNPDPDNTIRPETLAALKSLEKLGKSSNVSMNGANGYLKFYETYGSHFVSMIDVGDSIFQVFAYEPKEFKEVSEYYHKHADGLKGLEATSFRRYTVPRRDDGKYGYTAAIGKICITSGDPEMKKGLDAGLWIDKPYAGTNSIFAPFFLSDSVNINTTFLKTTAISFELASLEVFAEYYRMLIWRKVFKGAMYSKYSKGPGVAPYFCNNCPYDLDAVYKDSDPIDGDGLLSTLATPSVNICQEKIDLSKIVLQFPELVKNFSAFASGVQIPMDNSSGKTVINFPGSSNASIFGQIISCGVGPVPPTLRLTDSGFNEIKDNFFCDELYGGLALCNGDGTKMCVALNGLLFEYNNGTVAVVRDIRDSPSPTVITERITDISFALVAAEARLNFLLSNTTDKPQEMNLIKWFLLWIARITSTDNVKDEQLAVIQARALYLAKMTSKEQDFGVPVPYLRYEAYKDVVNNVEKVIDTAVQKLTNFQTQIRRRKAEERQIERESVLNENIIRSGTLLHEYIGVQASYQQSMENVFLRVVKDKEAELHRVTKQTDTLSKSLADQRKKVDDAVSNYKDAVAKWQEKQTISAALSIASNIFTLGFSFITPSSSISALESLGKTVQKIQKAINVFNAVINVYKSIKALPKDPLKAISELNDIGPNGLEVPSALEWDEMKVNFDGALSAGPKLPEKTSLCTAFSILVLRGKALLQCQNTLQKIAADLSAAKQRITLHAEQKKRLDGLKLDLTAKPKELDVAKIDLVGLSGQLLFFQRQMLMTMASTVVIQDRALQYEYLRPPTPIGSFTMLNLQLAILNQSQSINEGLTVQPKPKLVENPIVYEIHGVNPESLIKNQSFSFSISINKREFAPYNYVRVKDVQVEIGGIVHTKSGKYYTELVFDGHPFFDRDFNGNVLEFQTASRVFTGLQEVSSSSHEASGVPKVVEHSNAYIEENGQDPFDNKVSDITPFSMWRISLPDTQSNQDIMFDDNQRRVTVRLIFKIYAQLKESNTSPSNSMPGPGFQLVEGTAAPADNESLSDSVKDTLDLMDGVSVLAGWDVVFSMTAKEVNDQLSRQYEDRRQNPKFLRETGDTVYEYKNSIGNSTRIELNLTFYAPKLQFLQNNSDSAQIKLYIKSGSYNKSIKYAGDTKWHLFSKVKIEEDKEKKEDDNPYVMGDVSLATMIGSVTSHKDVIVKLNDGSFKIRNLKGHDVDNDTKLALDHYFSNLKDGYEVYKFGTLDFKEHSMLKSLTPTQFKFHVHQSNNKGDLLQLFIATTGKCFSATSLTLVDPIPKEYESSLIINSKIFFQDVLPASLGGIGLSLESVEPSGNKSWSSKAASGLISCYFPETIVGDDFMYPDLVKVPNDKIEIDLEGLKLQHVDSKNKGRIKMDYNMAKKYKFSYGITQRQYPGGVSWDDYSLKITLSVSSSLPITVSGSGQYQSVEIDCAIPDVDLSGNIEPAGGACKSSDHDMQKAFKDKLNQLLPRQIIDMFNHKFQAVSLFALKNLLFPAKNLIDMKKAYVPGDMVVFGSFT